MSWFSRKRKAPPPTLPPIGDIPRAGAKIELDEVEQFVAETEFRTEYKRFSKLTSEFNHQVSESVAIEMGYSAERKAVFEVAKKRNRYGDYVGAINSGMKAWGLEDVKAELRKSQGDSFASQTSFILNEISESFAGAGDIPRAITFLDEAISAVGNGHFNTETKGLIEVWEERRDELFQLYDRGMPPTPDGEEHTIDPLTGNFLPGATDDPKHFPVICQYCSADYVMRVLTLLRKQNHEIFELHEFSNIPRLSLMKLSISKGTDVNRFDDLGGLPIHYAAQTGHVQAIGVLTGAGADVNAPSEDRWSSLMLAAEYGHLDATKFLLDAGADSRYVGEGGWTALHRAGAMGHTDVARLLIEAGSERERTDDEGLSPRKLAESKGHADTAQFL